MKLKHLLLKGAIGINKGINLEEINIDFTLVPNGLVALTGKNGCGKTTIMENLHPFRSVVSRKGSFADHFYLKDSKKILTFEMNGNNYECKIFIDALSNPSKTEAYIYENDNPLNDGKVTSYDRVVENLFGTPELFFSSVFTGQKSMGIAGKKPSERHKLFHEILGLSKYYEYAKKTKELSSNHQIKFNEISGAIQVLESQYDKISNLQNTLSEKQTILNDIEIQIADQKEKKAKFELHVSVIKKQIESTDQIELQNAKIYEQISAEEQLKETITNELNENIQSIKDEVTKLNNGVIKLQYDIKEDEKDLEALNKLVDPINIEKINKNLKSKSDLEKQILEISDNISIIQTERENILIELQIIDKELQDKVYSEQEKCDELKKNIEEKLLSENSAKSLITSEYSNQLLDLRKVSNQLLMLNDKLSIKENELERIKKDTEIISSVPCNQEVGKNCLFLQNAYNSKGLIAGIEKEINTLKEEISNSNNSINEDELKTNFTGKLEIIDRVINELTSEIKSIDEQKSGLKEKLKLQFTDKYNTIGDKLVKADTVTHNTAKVTAEKELNEINKFDWQNLSEQSKKAQSKIEVIAAKNLKSQLDEKKQRIEEMTAKITKLNDSYNDRILKIDQRIQKYKSELKIIDKSILELQQSSLNNSLQNINNELEKQLSLSNEINSEIASIKAEISRLEIVRIEIEQMHHRMETESKEISEYELLTKAFDKNGIPALKLENSGAKVSAITNQLLELFDNEFRVLFETTKLSKDGKSQLETFDIKVIDSTGLTELENKSGGQQVWIETAITLAIAIVLREQGKQINSLFLDEKDGALDVDNANLYIKMIEKAQEIMKIDHAFIITHRPELLDFITNKVSLSKDNGIEIKIG